MKYINILITPDMSVQQRESDKPYHAFPEFHEGENINSQLNLDEQLPDGRFIHTKTKEDGTYILIVKKIKT